MKLKQFSLVVTLLLASQAHAETIPNPLIDAPAFRKDVFNSLNLRETRRLTEDKFIEMAKEEHTIVLDARSANRFAQLHIAGAKNLPFTEFTETTLAQTIPSKNTRILIYCNNNFSNSPVAFASKMAPASLNLSTYTALYTYGYKNVYELGPLVDPAKAKLKFQGSLAIRNDAGVKSNTAIWSSSSVAR